MAIIISTKDPKGLLQSIYDAIDSKDISTWDRDESGDLTHNPDQWNRKAWFVPKIQGNKLVFGIVGPKPNSIDKAVYGIYHGHFVYQLLFHFDELFDEITATALLSSDDYSDVGKYLPIRTNKLTYNRKPS